jgi:hypothetical protein
VLTWLPIPIAAVIPLLVLLASFETIRVSLAAPHATFLLQMLYCVRGI